MQVRVEGDSLAVATEAAEEQRLGDSEQFHNRKRDHLRRQHGRRAWSHL